MTQDITSLIEKLEGAEVGSDQLSSETIIALGGTVGSIGPLPVTTSLDAALALAERVLPGWAWNIDRWGKMSRVTLNECDAEGWHKSTHRRIEVAAEQTLALALCAAILRAKQ